MPWKNDQVSNKETEYIIEMARKQLSVPGDFVEFGCYRGDTSLLLADVIKNSPKSKNPKNPNNSQNPINPQKPETPQAPKRLWLYDSFDGLPEKSPQDASALGKDFNRGELQVSKREVKERFLRAGLKTPIIKKAWFDDLTPDDLPDTISLAFLDGDFYESIKTSLELVEPRMSDQGIIIIHDYHNPALPGVARAVDEWLGALKTGTLRAGTLKPNANTPETSPNTAKISTRRLQVLETCAIIEVVKRI